MSKSSKKDMGKGIRALLANIEREPAKDKEGKSKNSGDLQKLNSVSELDINAIEPNPFQPRIEFNEESLEELKQSIDTFGIIQPISVRRLSANKYQIISGERRWRAAQRADLKFVPVYIREADDQGMLEMALLENIQRADLNPLEVSISYQRLLDECDLTHEELSDRLGKKRSSISNYLRLLKLPPMVQQAVKTEAITMGHAKVIAGVDRVEEQISVLEQILANHLSVRATENLLNKVPTRAESKPKIGIYDPEISKLSEKLSDRFGIKVKINRNNQGKGNITIPFNSDRELNDILDSIIEQ